MEKGSEPKEDQGSCNEPNAIQSIRLGRLPKEITTYITARASAYPKVTAVNLLKTGKYSIKIEAVPIERYAIIIRLEIEKWSNGKNNNLRL